jgi:hypothetical protein
MSLDQVGTVGEWTGRDLDELETHLAVGILVQLLEDERVFVADSAGRRGPDRALVAEEEHGWGVNAVRGDAGEFGAEQGRGVGSRDSG